MKPYRVWKDVYMVGGPEISDPYDCCVYLINTHPELVLIDSGAGRSFNRLVENIKLLKLNPSNLKLLITTHAHIDHIGSHAKFRENFKVKVVAHELDVDAIETGRGTAAELYGIIYQPCRVDIRLMESENTLNCGVYSLKLLHCPGHTPGSIAIYVDIDGVRVLFGHDIHGPYDLEGANPMQAKASLQKLIDLKADILCEGHFGVYKPADKVRRYIERYLEKL